MSLARVCQHLRSVGLPSKESARWASLLWKQARASGPEWVVQRLKSLKPLLIEVANTGRYTVPMGFATRKNRRGETIFKDGLLHRLFSLPQNAENLRLLEGFLRCYQVFKLDKISVNQQRKILNNIEGPCTGNSAYIQGVSNSLGKYVRKASKSVCLRITKIGDTAKSLPEMLSISSGKRSPYLLNGVWKTAPRSEVLSGYWWDYAQQDRATKEFWRKNPNYFEQRVTGNKFLVSGRPWNDGTVIDGGDYSAGTIAVIQEGGCKARTIANPMLLFQALGEPMKVKLQEFTRQLYPEICTFDHAEGYSALIQWLQEGRTVFCFDASAFTDRFPLSLQETVLDSLQEQGVLSREDVEAFRLVINKGWHWKQVGREVKWSVGQPLGYGPSFHLATLTHAVVCDALCVTSHKQIRDFRIVGDDIVIGNETLARKYVAMMENLGVEINQSKSVVSDKLGEFLGKIITKDGVNPSIKVRKIELPSQLHSALSYYGQRALDYLLPQERKWAVTAYLPEDLGGLGWRPIRSGLKHWLSITNQDRFARQRVLKDIYDFYGERPFGGSDGEREDVALLMEYYSMNKVHTDGRVRYEGIKFSFEDSERLPSLASANKGEVRLKHNSFTDLFDNQMRQLINPPKGTSSSDEATLRHAMVLLNDHGYINLLEKPVTGPSAGDNHVRTDTEQDRFEFDSSNWRSQIKTPRYRDLARDSENEGEVKNQIENDGYKARRPKG